MADKLEKVKSSGFLRGMLDGWRSSVGSQSGSPSPSPSHSANPISSFSGSREGDGSLEMVAEATAAANTSATESPSLQPSDMDALQITKHGFPSHPTAVAFDPVLRLFAIGNQQGDLRILGRPSIDLQAHHSPRSAVIQLLFVQNGDSKAASTASSAASGGAERPSLISVCADDSIHMWNIKGKSPGIVQTLKFQREKITYCHLPFQSNWMYIGTEKGNVHVANIETFLLSGYVINWNKVIELSRKTHPGYIMHLSDCPSDPNKLLIGFETGTLVLWDLRARTPETRINYNMNLRSVSWHHEGRKFLCSHTDGSLTTWNAKGSPTPLSVVFPHGAKSGDGSDEATPTKPEPCRPVFKVAWKTVRNGNSFIIFSGGLPYARVDTESTDHHGTSITSPTSDPSATNESSITHSSSSTAAAAAGAAAAVANATATTTASTTSTSVNSPPTLSLVSQTLSAQSLTIIQGKTTSVVEMEHNIIDFIALCENPYESDYNDPYAVAVLLENDLVVVDLTSPGEIISEAPDSLFQAKDLPEPPKQTFFKWLFTGGPSILDREGLFTSSPSVLDREELFGEENSGKGSKTIAKAIPGSCFDASRAQAGSLAGELAKVKEGFVERGEHLERLDDTTGQMASESEGFRNLSSQLLNKYKDRKWYQF